MALTVKSSAFTEGGMIPKEYTCDGEDISPQLEWTGAPEGTKSFAVICDDPDAPIGTFVHWVLFNLPAGTTELPKGVPNKTTLETGAKQGTNDFNNIGYGGPCPPGGTHRYYFKIYALDTELALKPGVSKSDLLNAVEGHILEEGRLMGKYQR